MSESIHEGNSKHYLREAGSADPDRPEIANVLAQVGIGYALLAIAEAINAHAEAIQQQNERD